MSTPDITLYHCPSACSQVTICALEMAKLPYALKLVNVPKGEQNSPEYLALAPLGKVPYAVIDGVGLSENIAILTLIAMLCPDAGIFPVIESPRDRADIYSGLCFCSGTMHPLVRGMLNPQRVTTGEQEGVREMSTILGKKNFSYAEKRLEDKGGWWLGTPSIVDVYLNWIISVSRRVNFDHAPYPKLDSLAERLKQAIPAFTAMLQEEEDSKAKLGL